MSDPSDLILRVNARGATVHLNGDAPVLVAAADLPQGGLIALDLAQPDSVVALFLTESHWSEIGEQVDASTDLDALARRLRDKVAAAALPEAWLRLAFVAGLARWYPDRLDEGLVAADLAAAQASAGLTSDAELSWQRAEAAVQALVSRTVDPLVHDELTRVLEAVGSSLAVLPPGVVERAERPVAEGHRAATVTTLPVERNRRPVADPRNFPARLLDTRAARFQPGSEGVLVTCPAYTPDAPAADDMLAVIYRAADEKPLASAALAREGDGYLGLVLGHEVSAQAASNDAVVELRTASSPHPALLDVSAATEVTDAQWTFCDRRQSRTGLEQAESHHTRLLLAERVRLRNG